MAQPIQPMKWPWTEQRSDPCANRVSFGESVLHGSLDYRFFVPTSAKKNKVANADPTITADLARARDNAVSSGVVI
jgi:hypothetical protein